MSALQSLITDCPQAPRRFFIGTQKAGSSYLYHLLASNKSLSLAKQSEVNFFGNHEKELSWYCSQFSGGTSDITIDISPALFKFGKTSAEHLFSVYEKEAHTLRFVLFLRDPLEYICSHYYMHRQQGYFSAHPELYPEVPNGFEAFIKRYPNYAKRGEYARLLEEWLTYFSREQFLIIPFEKYIRDEEATLKEICAFWKVPYQAMHASKVTQNNALRFRFLYTIKRAIINRPVLARLLRNNKLVQALHPLLTKKTKHEVGDREQATLFELLKDDVQKLDALSIDTSHWKSLQKNKKMGTVK